MIYDLLKQDREETTDFRKEVRTSHKETGERLSKIETTTEVQTTQIAEHMRRTDLLENLHKDNEKRIVVLEEPAKTFSTLKKWLLGVAVIAGAIVTISKALGLF